MDDENAPLLPASSVPKYTNDVAVVITQAEPARLREVREGLPPGYHLPPGHQKCRNLSEIATIVGPNQRERVPKAYLNFGFTLAIIAGLCFTSSNVMVKFTPGINSWQLLLVRCLSQIVAMVPIMACAKAPVIPQDWPTRYKVWGQGVLGGFLLLCIFVAVNRLPLGDATAIFFSSPAFTMVLSAIILRDHCGLYRTLIALILLSGVVVLCRPEVLFPPSAEDTAHPPVHPPAHHSNHSDINKDAHAGKYDFTGIFAAICVPILSAWIVIITRQAKHVHYSVLVFWFGVGGLIVAIAGNLYVKHPKESFGDWSCEEWVLATFIGAVGIIGSIVMNKAVQWVTPSKVMVVRSFEVVAAYILQLTVFDCPPHWTDLIGTLMVITAVLGMGLEDVLTQATGWRYL